MMSAKNITALVSGKGVQPVKLPNTFPAHGRRSKSKMKLKIITKNPIVADLRYSDQPCNRLILSLSLGKDVITK